MKRVLTLGREAGFNLVFDVRAEKGKHLSQEDSARHRGKGGLLARLARELVVCDRRAPGAE